MKKMPLRIRFTLTASLFLLLSCAALAAVTNYSANKLVDAAAALPSQSCGEADNLVTPEYRAFLSETSDLLAVEAETAAHYKLFQKETLIAACVIVVVGSIATYFAAGYVLKPIHTLSEEVKKRNIHTLDQPIVLPQSADEIQELTLSFNRMFTELHHSFAVQKQFSADAAHELRTPITVMQTKLDVMALRENISEDTRALMGSLNNQLERLTVLIEDLLLFSKDLPLDAVKPVSLFPLLKDVVEELSDLALRKQIDLVIEGEECQVLGQELLLERVFYNLIENAIKYSPPEKAVEIRLFQKKEGVYVLVTDQGEGIPEDLRNSIFEPFFRIDKSRSRSVGGNGLGLAICKKILDRHHAVISVLPNKPRGSIFETYFPS